MSMRRRSFVRALAALGVGAGAGLPTLSSLVPSHVRAGVEPSKVLFLYGANGVAGEGFVFTTRHGEPELFFPEGTGRLRELRNLRGLGAPELAPYLDQLAIVRGVHTHNGAGGSMAGVGSAHTGPAGMLLTGRVPQRAPVGYEAVYGMGASLDCEIARRIGGREPLVMRIWQAPSWAWADGLTWSSARVAVPSEDNPWNAYRRLFLSGEPPEVASEIAEGRRSVNDLLRDRFDRVLRSDRIGSFDRHKLEAHRALIREVETSMVCALDEDRVAALEGRDSSWFHANDNAYESCKRMIDVAVLALACGLHDVATLMTDFPGGNTVWTCPWDGYRLPTGSHRLSHHLADSDSDTGTVIANAHQLNALKDRIHMTLYAYALERMQAAGILAEGLAVFCTGEGSNAHGPQNLPFVLGGGASGRLRGGVSLVATGDYLVNGWATRGVRHGVMLNTIAALSGARDPSGAPFVHHAPGFQPEGILSDLVAA